MAIAYVIDGTPYDENGRTVDTGGSGFTDPTTGNYYRANGELISTGTPNPNQWWVDANGNLTQQAQSQTFDPFYGSINTQNKYTTQTVDTSNPGFSDVYTGAMGLPANKVADFYNLKTTDPHSYYTQSANALVNGAMAAYEHNTYGSAQGALDAIEAIKAVDPQAYYNAKLSLLSQQSGWQHGQNTFDKAAPLQAEIQSMIPEAIKAGMTPDQINQVTGTNFASASGANQNRIANEAATGGGGFSFTKDVLPGLGFVGAAAAAMLSGGALAPELGAGVGAGEAAIDSSAAALGGAGGGGAFIPAAGSGASFALPGAAAAIPTATTGADAVLNAPNVQVPGLGSGMPSGAAGGISAPLSGSGAVSGAGATTLGGGGLTGALPAGTIVGDGTLGTTMGATYMASAPGQFALDASGAAIPASSVGIGGYAPSSTSLADILKNGPSPKQIASAAQGLASLLSPSTALTGAASKLAAGANSAGQATTALTRGNTNPFVQEQNFQVSAPKNLASLLRQG